MTGSVIATEQWYARQHSALSGSVEQAAMHAAWVANFELHALIMHAQYEAHVAPKARASVHAGAQTLFVGWQAPVRQSPWPLHIFPGPQSPQVGPPQSTSVSMPLRTMSMHVGALQVCVAAAHTMLAHWPLTLHSTQAVLPSQ